MNRLLRTALALGAAATAAFGLAQSVYSPNRSAKDQGIVLKSWGSGTIAETDETAYEGSSSIRVSSRNFFQGGILNFSTPVDLSTAYNDKNSLLQFTFRLPESDVTAMSGGGNAGGAKGGKGGGITGSGLPGAGGGIAGGTAGGEAGARGGGAPGSSGGSTPATLTSDKVLEQVRVVITTTDGLKSEAFLDVKGKVADKRGWVKAGVPLQAVSGFDRTNKTLQSIAISGDAIATFYVGEVGILVDSTPVYGEINQGDLNLALGDEVTFVASGYAGASPLKYAWDFDATDGIQSDSEGQVVKRKFRKPGKYIVTLTVTDQYGLKAPYSTKINVEVNP